MEELSPNEEYEALDEYEREHLDKLRQMRYELITKMCFADLDPELYIDEEKLALDEVREISLEGHTEYLGVYVPCESCFEAGYRYIVSQNSVYVPQHTEIRGSGGCFGTFTPVEVEERIESADNFTTLFLKRLIDTNRAIEA